MSQLSSRLTLLLLALLLGASACIVDDESAGGPLSCALLEDPDNCWARSAAALEACLPEGRVGTLAEDRGSCTFEDGTRVVFASPLPQLGTELERFGFTIEKEGAACGSFVDTFENRLEVEAGEESAASQLRAGTFSLQCGDGATWTSSFDLLFTCPAGTAPTDGFEVEPELVIFTIVSVATPGELFRCVPGEE